MYVVICCAILTERHACDILALLGCLCGLISFSFLALLRCRQGKDWHTVTNASIPVLGRNGRRATFVPRIPQVRGMTVQD